MSALYLGRKWMPHFEGLENLRKIPQWDHRDVHTAGISFGRNASWLRKSRTAGALVGFQMTRRLKKHYQKFKNYSTQCPSNFEHKYQVLRLNGNG